MKNKKLSLILQYIIFFGLGFALIYYQYSKLSVKEIEELKIATMQFSERTWVLIPILFIGFFSHFFRALRWRLMFDSLSAKPRIINITAAVFIGYLTNLLLPRMGEVAKCTILAKYEKLPADKMIGTIVAERLFDLICLGLIALLTFAVQADVISNYFYSEIQQVNTSKIIKSVLIVFTVLIIGLTFVILFLRKNKTGKIAHFIIGIKEGISSIFKLEKKILFIVYTTLVWLCYFSLIYIGFYALEATEHLGSGAALSILVLGSIGMIITPGGLGAYPQIVQYLLLGFYGISSAYGLAFGWLSWLAQTIIVIIFGIISFVVLTLANKK